MPDGKPNILILWGDDIGWFNISHNNRGVMGYQTPNIDRIAHEGIEFTDYYGQQSCTAGRAAFITGQNPVRTGLTKVGCPGVEVGLFPEDPTIADLLKPLGYVTGQFGKNHLGDRNLYLPTVHGFDEFYGNLYHLNAEEEPEDPDYPQDPEFKKRFGPRGVIHSFADGRIEDTGPLTKKRMETVDEEITEHALRFIDEAHQADKPFFVWYNTTATHIWSHPQSKYVQMAVNEGRAEEDVVRAKMIEHDEQVGSLLKKLDELGVADNTIVLYSTDNGVELMMWPDGGMGPFRGEKGTSWEGGFRVPCLVKWPGHIKPGTELNGVQSHEDLFVTLAAAAGMPNLKQELLQGKKMGDMTYKVHLDGYNQLDYWMGKTEKSARREFFYYDETDLMAIRVDGWKMHIGVKPEGLWWNEKYYPNVPYLFNLLMDPMEKMDPESKEWGYIGRKFFAAKMWAPTAAAPFIAEHLKSLAEYPPRQKADTLSLKKALEETMKKLENPKGGNN